MMQVKKLPDVTEIDSPLAFVGQTVGENSPTRPGAQDDYVAIGNLNVVNDLSRVAGWNRHDTDRLGAAEMMFGERPAAGHEHHVPPLPQGTNAIAPMALGWRDRFIAARDERRAVDAVRDVFRVRRQERLPIFTSNPACVRQADEARWRFQDIAKFVGDARRPALAERVLAVDELQLAVAETGERDSFSDVVDCGSFSKDVDHMRTFVPLRS